MENTTEKKVAEILLSIKAVTLNLTKGYTWVSGIIAPIYCDNRMTISFPKERQKIVDYFIQTIKENNIEFDTLAGTATAGIPWAAFLAEKLEKPMIYVRSKQKGHGKGNQIEGVLKPGQKVLVIEDLISTGGSSILAVESVRGAGGDVVGCLAIFTYLFPESKEKFNNANCPLYVLSNFDSLIDVAEEQNFLTSEEKKAALSWNKDKTGWAKKVGLE